MPIAIPDKTLEIFNYLKKRAYEMRTVSYGRVAKEADIFPLAVGNHLDTIREEICIPLGLPFISAIVVNAATRRPGQGFLPDGMDVSEHEFDLFWRGMVLQVFATDWSAVQIGNDD